MPDALILASLARAVAAAEAFCGSTMPNPPVGCVLLDADGLELAVRAHQKAGEAHAEALATAACRHAGTADRIHTAVVTLEPCNHTGRTPPCTEALLATPVKRVVIGCRDPNPHVAGGGAARLAAAGVSVEFADDNRSQRLLAPFAKRVLTGIPWVTVKQAVTATGDMVPPPGQKTFTTADSLRLAHEMRKRADAIITGSGTILADIPAFTVRHVPDFPGKERILAILDRRRRVPDRYLLDARSRGFEVWVGDDIDRLLAQLGQRGCLEVLIESGPTLTHEIMSRDVWDEHVLIRQVRGADDVVVRRLRGSDGNG